MNCHFCGQEMIKKKEECFGCDRKGCTLCDHTGKLTIVQCTNPNCEPPDYDEEDVPLTDKDDLFIQRFIDTVKNKLKSNYNLRLQLATKSVI